MATIRIQVRRGTASQWTSVNPTLEAGEMGLETDTNKIKFGTGSTAWTALGYLSVGDIPEIAMDAINTALSLGSGLTKSYNDATDTIGISLDTAVVATLSGTQTLTNKTLTSPIINTPTGITKSDVGLANVNNTTDASKPISTAAQTALDLKAPLASPTFTGTVTGVTKAHVGLGNVDNTSDASKPISSATQTALDAKATNAALASHETDTTSIHGIANTALLATMDYVDTAVSALSSSVDTDFIPVGDRGTLNGVAPLNASVKIDNVYLTSDVVLKDETQTLTNKSLTSPALTGTPTAPTAAAGTNTTQVATTAYTVAAINALIDGAPGTLNTLNELAAAVNDDASYAAAIASELTAKAPLASPSFSGTVSLPPTTSIGSVNGTTIAYLDGVTSAIQTQINAKASVDSPTFTGTVVGIGKSMVGLGNVDNTTDAAKPVSTATQNALNLKAALAAPTFTGAVVLPTTTVLGVSNLEGSINLKAPLASPTFTGTVTLPAGTITSEMILDSAITSGKIADGTIVNADISGTAAISTSKIDGLDNTLSSKAPTASPVFTGTVVLPATTSIGDVSAEELQSISTVVSNVQTQISSKANSTNASIAGATFTGTVVLPSTTSIADVSSTEISYLNNVTGNIQTQLDAKLASSTASSTYAPLVSPTFTGTVTLPDNTISQSHMSDNSIGTAEIVGLAVTTAKIADSAVTSAKIADLTIVDGDISTSAAIATSKISGLDTALSLKAPLDSPTFTGTVTLPVGTITSGMILDGTIVDADINASAAIAQSKISGLSTSLGLKADLASPALTGIPTAPLAATGTNTTQVATTSFVQQELSILTTGAPALLNTLDELAAALGDDANYASTVTTALSTKAPLASPTFTGTVSGITKTMVGLGSVDNTADLAKPISTATQTALDLKAPLDSPTFTGTVTVAASGIAFTDGTQTKEGVPSRTTISSKTADYTLSALTERDVFFEMNSASATTFTVPTDATLNFPIGTSIDILRVGAGAVTIAAATPGTTTINATPGNKLRAQWSSATLFKRAANTWILMGDLTA